MFERSLVPINALWENIHSMKQCFGRNKYFSVILKHSSSTFPDESLRLSELAMQIVFLMLNKPYLLYPTVNH